jgi:hypothetical protein
MKTLIDLLRTNNANRKKTFPLPLSSGQDQIARILHNRLEEINKPLSKNMSQATWPTYSKYTKIRNSPEEEKG